MLQDLAATGCALFIAWRYWHEQTRELMFRLRYSRAARRKVYLRTNAVIGGLLAVILLGIWL